jgi:two-component system, sensor histidine kinase
MPRDASVGHRPHPGPEEPETGARSASHCIAAALRGDRPLRFFAGGGLLLMASYFAQSGAGALILGPVTDLVMLASVVMAMLFRPPDRPRLVRRFWQLWAAGLLSWAVVALIDLVQRLMGSSGPPGAGLTLIRTLSFTGIYLGAIVAVELRPHAPAIEARSEGLRWLAATGSALTALALLVYLVILPSFFDVTVAGSNVPASVLYLCLDCFLLWRLTAQAVEARAHWRAVYAVLFAVVSLWALSDGAEALRWAGWLAESRFAWLVDVVWWPQFLGLMLAARLRGSEVQATTGEARGTQLLALTLLVPGFHALLLTTGAWAPGHEAATGLWLLAAVVLLGSLTVVYLRRLEQLAAARADELGLAHAALAANIESMRVARDQADSANRAKSQFLANMSHEVRTPLNGVLGTTELLIESGLTPSQRRLADLARSSGESLLAIVDDILDFSRIEAGRLELEQVNFELRETVESVIELLSERARAKNLALRAVVAPEAPVVVRGDPGRLRQILINLVGNAVKFTPQGEVVLRVLVAGSSGPSALLDFEVRDTGIGIAPEARSRIFDAFAQADGSTTRRYGGTGLGLAICKQLVGLMGGDLTVESVLGVGSTFRFQASFGIEAPLALTAASAKAHLGGRTEMFDGRVLLVEDGEVNMAVAEGMLQVLGVRVDLAADGVEALKALSNATYDLVLMDCMMPGMDGYEATAELRRREAGSGRRTPVAALTANAMSGDRERCEAAGMDDYLSKPFRAEELRQLLARWLPARKASTEASV